MVFYSKRDTWLGILLFGITIPISFSTFLRLGLSWASLMMFLVVAYIILIWFETKYVITDEWLIVSCGFTRIKIKIYEIITIEKTRNPISAPACSMDRMEIISFKRTVIISPKDKAEFIKCLKERNPDIIIRGFEHALD